MLPNRTSPNDQTNESGATQNNAGRRIGEHRDPVASPIRQSLHAKSPARQRDGSPNNCIPTSGQAHAPSHTRRRIDRSLSQLLQLVLADIHTPSGPTYSINRPF